MARGSTQTPGLDYHETYSPTVRLSTLKRVCEQREARHQVSANEQKDSLPQCNYRRDFAGAARIVKAGRRRHGKLKEGTRWRL